MLSETYQNFLWTIAICVAFATVVIGVPMYLTGPGRGLFNGNIPFDRERWKTVDPEQDNTRWAMARSLRKRRMLHDKSPDEIEEMLGRRCAEIGEEAPGWHLYTPYESVNAGSYDMIYYWYIGNETMALDIDPEVFLAVGFRNGKAVRIWYAGS